MRVIPSGFPLTTSSHAPAAAGAWDPVCVEWLFWMPDVPMAVWHDDSKANNDVIPAPAAAGAWDPVCVERLFWMPDVPMAVWHDGSKKTALRARLQGKGCSRQPSCISSIHGGQMQKVGQCRSNCRGCPVRPTAEDSRAAREARRAGEPGSRARERRRAPFVWHKTTHGGKIPADELPLATGGC